MNKVTLTKKKDGTVIYSTGGGFMSGLKNTLRRGLSNMFGRGKMAGVTGIIGRSEVIPDYSQQASIDEGFCASTWIYAIISKNAKKFGSIPRYLYDEKKLMQEKATRIRYQIKAAKPDMLFESDLNKLLDRPNENQGGSQFFALAEAFYLTTGEAFIWLNRGNAAQRYDPVTDTFVDRTDKEIDELPVLEMYVLPSPSVNVLKDPNNVFGISGYELVVLGRKIPIRKGDIIHWRDLNLKFDASTGEHLRGFPRMKAGDKTVQESKDIAKSSVKMFQNDGAKGILFSENLSAEDVTPQQESDIRRVVNAKINDNDIKGAVALLMGSKWEYIDLAFTSVDMNLIEARVKNAQELCALFDTPHLLFVPSDATLANLENTKRNWVNDAIIPLVKELDELLTLKLTKAFKLVGKARIVSDFSELPEMQLDVNKVVDSMSKAWWVTPNQKLIAMGYEASTEPRMNEVWVPSGIQPLSEVMVDDGYEEQLQELEKRGIKR
jgi:phage portal protein BeeE